MMAQPSATQPLVAQPPAKTPYNAIPGVSLPIAWLLALDDNTLLKVMQNGTVSYKPIPKHHVAISSGDLVHGGVSYAKRNRRIHGYFNTPEHPAVEQVQGWWV
jgi:hypothetical protein